MGNFVNSNSRRTFLKSSATAALASGVVGVSGHSLAKDQGLSRIPFIKKGATVLIQGDSITDAGRDRNRGSISNDPRALGSGYAFNIASSLLLDRPQDGLKFFNRGNSGWKVPQLAGSWDKNCIAIKPDVLSILIGVNDYWHTLGGKYKGTVETYESGYRALLQRTVKELPGIKLVICEPYALRCGPHVNDSWFPVFDQYRAVSKKMADEFNAVFVPFQQIFDDASKDTPPDFWAHDGIHPNSPGAQMMALEWLRLVKSA